MPLIWNIVAAKQILSIAQEAADGRRIVGAAESGERDPEQLYRLALKELGFNQYSTETGSALIDEAAGSHRIDLPLRHDRAAPRA